MRTQPKTPSGRSIDALSLAVVFGILYAGVSLAPALRGEATFLAAMGFLLLAGTLTGELVELLKLPHLTGYLVVGVVAGPHVLRLIDETSVQRLQPVNTLALALIALAGGAELKLDTIKSGLKSLSVATFVQSAGVLVTVSAVFVGCAHWLLPFTRSMSTPALVGVALLWGVVAVSRSPAATLAILSQTRARGPLTRFALAFVMSSDVVVVLLLAGALAIARPLIEPGAQISFAAFKVLGHELLGSVAIGTTLGLVLALYVKLVGRQLLVVLVALGFGATETLRYLQFDPLLAFLVAGFVVQNLSRQGDRFLHAIEETGAVVYVVFFGIAGAQLDIPLLRKLWPVALLLAAVRGIVTFGAGRVSTALAKDDPVLRTWGWTALVAQAGMTQGIANVITREFPSFGGPFGSLVVANVALNSMIGPVLFKLALDRTKETKSPTPSLTDPEEVNA